MFQFYEKPYKIKETLAVGLGNRQLRPLDPSLPEYAKSELQLKSNLTVHTCIVA